MKKYVITEAQLDALKLFVHWTCFGNCRYNNNPLLSATDVALLFDNLKPIEPLSDEEIVQALETATQPQPFGSDGEAVMWAIRAIERHIIGSEE
jgi:hypothetical protein